ncbi:2OG-Fe(II) oxygenase [Dinghuibacter silviterrae]|uniref:Prolyl 4-hydroxylase alpha subunit domain-containing protein n=1 Tax=Dinghuibacter silviterrae TaxID=1539049 RepID=A0A4V3GLP2_9BACT|nr:2OG-Fe(II) oxygenase [Dinghuibacter silviterrae]TDX00303.1 hypothetical protein EDB95_1324 [Dinghuibacter silviterrae]
MTTIQESDWIRVQTDLHRQGFALLPHVLTPAQCAALIDGYDQPDAYRKTIKMERHRFGVGEYKYFRYPLPPLIEDIRTNIYPHLAVTANQWMAALHEQTRFPAVHADLLTACRAAGQHLPTVLILKYGAGGFNTLHQDLYGEVYFPLQAVLFLNEPGEDYEGGEFVLTEQVPRAQSKAIVLKPRRGDMLVFTTHFRPVQGSRGYYRVNVKHGVSPLHSGARHTLGIIFHDAVT